MANRTGEVSSTAIAMLIGRTPMRRTPGTREPAQVAETTITAIKSTNSRPENGATDSVDSVEKMAEQIGITSIGDCHQGVKLTQNQQNVQCTNEISTESISISATTPVAMSSTALNYNASTSASTNDSTKSTHSHSPGNSFNLNTISSKSTGSEATENVAQRAFNGDRFSAPSSSSSSSSSPSVAEAESSSSGIPPAYSPPATLTSTASSPRKAKSTKATATASSTSTPAFVNYIFRIDSLFIMLTMVVIAIVVISGNAVDAAHRDSLKSKNSRSISHNANAIIPLGADGSNDEVGNAASDLNGNSIINGNTDRDTNRDVADSSSPYDVSTTTTNSHHTYGGISHKTLPGGGINRNTIEFVDDARNVGPYFDKAASKNVTALLGKTAYLNCRVKNLGNKTMLLQVSWVRHRDIHLLTVGRYTYTSDQRFRAIHQPQTEDWILQIKYPQHRDSGIYECQVSTTPHMSHYIHLNVVEPSTEIIGAPDLYIESGSTINLTCVVFSSPEPPAYIFWNHNNAIINYDSPRGGVSVVTNKGETTQSFLLIRSARPSDSGSYQCNPSNAKTRSVTVHVLNGEFPAAMQRAVQAHQLQMSHVHYLLVYLLMSWSSVIYYQRYIQ